ncbi:hypothetical protein ACFVUN_04000 [Kitasatospora griseola]|uniref:hypothetical protein n=1 Tax=Kitasatospora griseola TaxID=2064 RepID=UPI0036D90618
MTASHPHEVVARPRAAAGVLFFDPEGRLLLVKPTYQDGWEICPSSRPHPGR